MFSLNMVDYPIFSLLLATWIFKFSRQNQNRFQWLAQRPNSSFPFWDLDFGLGLGLGLSISLKQRPRPCRRVCFSEGFPYTAGEINVCEWKFPPSGWWHWHLGQHDNMTKPWLSSWSYLGVMVRNSQMNTWRQTQNDLTRTKNNKLTFLFRDAQMMQQLECPAATLKRLQARKGACC